MPLEFTGVRQARSVWIAFVYIRAEGNRKQVHLGTFKDACAAAKARDKALLILGKETEMQVGLTEEERQQLQGVSLDQLKAALNAASSAQLSSAYRGVCRHKTRRKYRARITLPARGSKYLGTFVDEVEAAHAYDKAAIQQFGSKAHLNFPEAYNYQSDGNHTGKLVTQLARGCVIAESAPKAKVDADSMYNAGLQPRPDAQFVYVASARAESAAAMLSAAANDAKDKSDTTDDAMDLPNLGPESESDSFHDDLSDWGSDEEIWGYETEYYDTEEEEEAIAELLAHPDYQYLVKHGGEPSLSLLGGPEHDISAANLWKKLMNKWAAEGEAAEGTGPHAQTLAQTLHSGTPTAAAKRSSLDQLMGKWAADVQARLADTSTPSPDSSSTLQVLPGSAVGPAGGLEQPLAEPTASVMALPGSSAATDGTRPAAAASSRHYLAAAPPVRSLIAAAAAGAGGTFAQLEPRSASDAWLQPKELRTPLPSEDAVKMANIGSDSVPGMSPAEYREALYHTWGTGQPAGMQYMASDSDDEGTEFDQIIRRAEGAHQQGCQDRGPNKRCKLSDAVDSIGEQVRQMETGMAASSPDLASPSTDDSCNPGSSIPWWAEEMGMTESEYCSGFQECLDNAEGCNDSRITPVKVTQEDQMYIASRRCVPGMSAIQL